MKKSFLFCAFTLVLSLGSIAAPSSKKKPLIAQPEQEEVAREVIKDNGIAMSESLSEDGMSIIMVPYRWFAGIHTADNRTIAIEIARREATNTVSRTLLTLVEEKAKRRAVEGGSKVYEALESCWRQESSALLNGCEPFGDVVVDYDPETGMYTAIAKVAMRGDRFNKALEMASKRQPEGLTLEESELYHEINREIVHEAKAE